MMPNPKEPAEREPRQPERFAFRLLDALAVLFCLFLFALGPILLATIDLTVHPALLFAWFTSLGLGGCIASAISSAKGRRPIPSFALGMILGPILSLLLLLDAGDPRGKGLLQCPFCAEWIKPAAKLCKHCGSPQDAFLSRQRG